MERITISLEKNLVQLFDELIQYHGYQNRSEAMRDILREKIQEMFLQRNQSQYCLANVSYIYKYNQRDLAKRLLIMQHDACDVVVANSHIYLDPESCMGTLVLRGGTNQVQKMANQIIAERGVCYGNVSIMPTRIEWKQQA